MIQEQKVSTIAIATLNAKTVTITSFVLLRSSSFGVQTTFLSSPTVSLQNLQSFFQTLTKKLGLFAAGLFFCFFSGLAFVSEASTERFFSSARAIILRLLSFFVQSVFAAETTILVHLKSVRIIFLVFCCVIISLLAF